jgi:hypothetical protein
MRIFAMLSSILLIGTIIGMESPKPEPANPQPTTAKGTLILKNLLARELKYNYMHKIENRRILSNGNVQPLASVTVDPDPSVKKNIELKPWGIPITLSIVDQHNGTTQTFRQSLVALGLYELDYNTQEGSIIITGPKTP